MWWYIYPQSSQRLILFIPLSVFIPISSVEDFFFRDRTIKEIRIFLRCSTASSGLDGILPSLREDIYLRLLTNRFPSLLILKEDTSIFFLYNVWNKPRRFLASAWLICYTLSFSSLKSLAANTSSSVSWSNQ